MRKVYTSHSDFLKQNETYGTGLPFSADVSVLGQAKTVGGITFPNRLVCQPMEGCDGTPGGSPDELTLRRYDRLARGGAGLVWYEATAVMEEGRANPRQLYITEQNLDDYKRQVERIKEEAMQANGYEPVVIMQATHSGRYSKPNGTPAPLIAYNNPIFEKDNPISKDRIVTDDYLDAVGEALVQGARLAEQAGFDGVDIKCCHRYLNSELLSAYEREGRYGGSLEFDPTEPVWLLQQLYSYGVRLLDITMGNPYFNPHVNRPFAMGGYTAEEHPIQGVKRMLSGIAKLKEQVPEMALICSALTYLGVAAPNVAAAYIGAEQFDFAGFGRTILAYPNFAKDILSNGAMDPKKICICCSKCTEIMRKPGGTPGCVVRDKEVYLPIHKQLCGGAKA